MIKIRNISSMGDITVPALRRTIEAGEVIDVTDAEWELLSAQPDNYQRIPFAEYTDEELAAAAAARGINPTSKKLAEQLESAIAPPVDATDDEDPSADDTDALAATNTEETN